MKKIKLIFILLLIKSSIILSSYSIAFIHIGKNIPTHIKDAISQARLFNEKAPIFLVSENTILKDYPCFFENLNVTFINIKDLLPSEEHKIFNLNCKLDTRFRNGFWKYTTERFFYLDELIKKYKLTNIFHLESDVMLYTNLEEILSVFKKNYLNVAATFDNEKRCIAGLIYFANKNSSNNLINFISKIKDIHLNDMQLLAKYKNLSTKDQIDYLPIITKEYTNKFQLKSISGQKTKEPKKFYNNIEEFNSIFDAAALGQYIGGIDPRNNGNKPSIGFINESCLFSPSLLNISWIIDHKGRRVPYIIHGEKKYRINNLHIHCKNLKKFAS